MAWAYSVQAQIVGLIACFVLSAYFSASEAALLSVSRTRIRHLSDQGSRRGKLVLDLLSRPKRLLATILIGNNIVNTGAAVLATAIANYFFESFALSIAAGATTFILLFFGEVTPKTFANQHAEWVSLRVARPIRFFEFAFWPVQQGLNWLAKPLLRLAGTRVKPAQFHTEEEIKVMLKVGKEKGHIDETEAKIIRKVFEFNDLELADVMVPFPQVRWVRQDEPLNRIVQLVAESRHERFPVLDDAQRPLGLVVAMDLLLMAPEQRVQLRAGSLVRAITRFTPDFHVGIALERMQADGSPIAAVVDDHGTMVGLVTLKDLLEQIVGEIPDEAEMNRRHIALERARMRAVSPRAKDGAASGASPDRPTTQRAE